jgi:hypothetical protein
MHGVFFLISMAVFPFPIQSQLYSASETLPSRETYPRIGRGHTVVHVPYVASCTHRNNALLQRDAPFDCFKEVV